MDRLIRKGRWNPPRAWLRRILTEDWAAHERTGDYAKWLIKQLGRPMERALIKARQRYDAQKPARIRASRLHRAYRRKRR